MEKPRKRRSYYEPYEVVPYVPPPPSKPKVTNLSQIPEKFRTPAAPPSRSKEIQ